MTSTHLLASLQLRTCSISGMNFSIINWSESMALSSSSISSALIMGQYSCLLLQYEHYPCPCRPSRLVVLIIYVQPSPRVIIGAVRFQSLFRHGYSLLCMCPVIDAAGRLPANTVVLNDAADVLPRAVDKFYPQIPIAFLME